MKLSEAILAGSRLHPQAFRVFRSDNGSTCALGAAADGIHVRGQHDLVSHFPELLQYLDESQLPADLAMSTGMIWKLNTCTLGMAIEELNDSCHWTRERIARWVAHLERK